MRLDDFYNMTPRNFANAQLGYKAMYDQTQQAEWERSRWMACVIINPHLKRAIDPKKITRFPWEIKKSSVDFNQELIDKIRKESEYDDKVQESINKDNA
tara:strand:+ start:603 stop:899 length:297 start_codon:yes stop_codon:yes gene_type:complete